MSYTPLCQSLSKLSSKSSQYCLGSQKNPVFRRFIGFPAAGIVFESSNITNVTPWVHTFLGKEEFFKSFEKFLKFEYTYTHTHTHSPPITNIVIDIFLSIKTYKTSTESRYIF